MKSILLRKMVSPITFTKTVLKQGTIVRVAQDFKNEKITGIFYFEELQKI